MTKGQIVAWGGQSGTFDYSLPQPFVDAMRELGVENPAGEYIWVYDEKSPKMGRPVSLCSLMIQAIEKGQLVPRGYVSDAIEMAISKEYKQEQIMSLVDSACKNA